MAIEAWLGRNNTVEIELYDNAGLLINHSLITRMLIVLGTLTLDSNVEPSAFVFTNPLKVVFLPSESLVLTAGYYTSKIITYDSTNTKGLVWNGRDIIVRQV